MNHLIQSQQIELSLQGDEKSAFALQERMSHFFQAEMLPKMADVLDQWVGEDQIWQIDKIELDLGVLAEDELFSPLGLDRFAERLALALQSQAGPKINADPKTPQARARLWQVWLHFLEKGTLPWYVKQLPVDLTAALLPILQTQSQARQELKILCQKRPAAMRRLVLQMEEQFLLSILPLYDHSLAVKSQQLWEAIRSVLSQSASAQSSASLQNTSFERLRQEYWQFQIEQLIVLPSSLNESEWIQNNQVWLSLNLKGMSPTFWQDLAKIKPEFVPMGGTARGEASEKGADESKAVSAQNEKDLREQMPLPEGTEDLAFGEAAPSKIPPDSKQKVPRPEPKSSIEPTKGKKLDPQGQSPIDAQRNEKPASDERQSLVKGDSEVLETEDESVASLAQASSDPNKQNEREVPASDETIFKIQAPQKAKSAQLLSDQVHFLPNAGIILCHAYLMSFWRNLGWLEGTNLKDLEAQELAVLSLHYLATGEGSAPEYQLTLAKILCGLPLNHPLNVRLALAEETVAEAENLLAAIVTNWGALGEVSNDSLREGFLQRSGKLSLKSGKWRLQIERQTIDILLNRLPWSIGVVKLPWMADPIMVDWN